MGTIKKRKRRHQGDLLVLRLLLLVAAVLFIFEGPLIYKMLTHRSSSVSTATASGNQALAAQTESANASVSSSSAAVSSGSADSAVADVPLAGLSAAVFRSASQNTGSGASAAETETETEDPYLVSEELDSPAVVRQASSPVDDSYFSDAVFIGDSRMEGFRNSSGITQGTFLTSVGLSTDSMSDATIATAEGTISVYQGLSGRQYGKIYVMLGTNDLGYYPWEDFPVNFQNVMEQFHKLQPNAIIYVCSVIYVEEAKIVTSYDNNDNVRKINSYLLQICEDLDYCHYINLNEIFTNGYGSLLEGASSDGIHLYETYCKQMLDYLKSHYVDDSSSSLSQATDSTSDDTSSDTEGSGGGSDNA